MGGGGLFFGVGGGGLWRVFFLCVCVCVGGGGYRGVPENN